MSVSQTLLATRYVLAQRDHIDVSVMMVEVRASQLAQASERVGSQIPASQQG